MASWPPVTFRLVVAVLAIGLAACGPTSNPQSAAPTGSPRLALPTCHQPISAIYAVHLTPVGGGAATDAIYCVTLIGEADLEGRLLEWPVEHRQLLAADSRSVVEVNGANVDGSNELVMFDLGGAATARSLGTLGSLGIGDPGPLGAVLSPDGSQLAIAGAHKVLLIQMQSGEARPLATVPADEWLMPLRWTAAGILARKVGSEGMGDFGLVKVDASTGTISTLNQGPNNQLVVSPNGKYFAFTTHADLGDGPTLRYPWQNSIYRSGQDGVPALIISAPNHWFTPLDVSDDGQVLFASDSQTDPVAADMGVYVTKDGHLTRQLTSSFSGEWSGPARFLGASRAFVTHIQGGIGAKETSVDPELYHLCTDTAPGCTVSRMTVSTFPGTWPTQITSVIVLPARAG
jgi:hypothetical protein